MLSACNVSDRCAAVDQVLWSLAMSTFVYDDSKFIFDSDTDHTSHFIRLVEKVSYKSEWKSIRVMKSS